MATVKYACHGDTFLQGTDQSLVQVVVTYLATPLFKVDGDQSFVETVVYDAKELLSRLER